jgi:lysophospholipase L1-like esterase
MMHRPLLVILKLFTGALLLAAQPSDYPFIPESYPFVRYDLNKIYNYPGNIEFNGFLAALDSVFHQGNGDITIVHFGGSHIQAGTFPREVMSRLASTERGLSLGTFYFPYSAAGTNTPRGYQSNSWGKWKGVKNTESTRTDSLGMAGISIISSDSNAGFSITPDPALLEGEHITLLLGQGSSFIPIGLDSSAWELTESGPGYLIFKALKDNYSIEFSLKALDTMGIPLKFYGLYTHPQGAGIRYIPLGVNGAHINSYLGCELLNDQLSHLKPDLVILSIGINDAHGNGFSQEVFRSKYETLISHIRQCCPGTAIMLTTNTDSYIRRRYLNRNALLVRETMLELAESQQCVVWDWFTVMGGLNSIRQWQDAGLAQGDRVHFTREGYSLSGDLLFEAILKAYEEYIQQMP